MHELPLLLYIGQSEMNFANCFFISKTFEKIAKVLWTESEKLQAFILESEVTTA